LIPCKQPTAYDLGIAGSRSPFSPLRGCAANGDCEVQTGGCSQLTVVVELVWLGIA